MNMNKNKSLAMIACSAIILSMGFQNCSKVGVMDASNPNDKMSNGAVAGGPDVRDGNASDPNTTHTPKPPLTPEQQREQLVKRCMMARGGAIRGPVVNIGNGAVTVETDYFESITGGNGALVVKGLSEQAHGILIHVENGAILMCGMVVDELEAGNGAITLVNSHIKNHLKMGNGALLTYHSTVEGTIDMGNGSSFDSLDEP